MPLQALSPLSFSLHQASPRLAFGNKDNDNLPTPANPPLVPPAPKNIGCGVLTVAGMILATLFTGINVLNRVSKVEEQVKPQEPTVEVVDQYKQRYLENMQKTCENGITPPCDSLLKGAESAADMKVEADKIRARFSK